MKIRPISLGRGCTVGALATLLPDVALGDGARVGDVTVVMKGESVPGGAYCAPRRVACRPARLNRADASERSHPLRAAPPGIVAALWFQLLVGSMPGRRMLASRPSQPEPHCPPSGLRPPQGLGSPGCPPPRDHLCSCQNPDGGKRRVAATTPPSGGVMLTSWLPPSCGILRARPVLWVGGDLGFWAHRNRRDREDVLPLRSPGEASTAGCASHGHPCSDQAARAAVGSAGAGAAGVSSWPADRYAAKTTRDSSLKQHRVSKLMCAPLAAALVERSSSKQGLTKRSNDSLLAAGDAKQSKAGP